MQFGKKSFIIRALLGQVSPWPQEIDQRIHKCLTLNNLPPVVHTRAGMGLTIIWARFHPGNRDSVPIRFGDFQFEPNLEYRFPLIKLWGYDFGSSLFADIGNVWFLRKNPDFPDGTLTRGKFLKDMAVCAGTGYAWILTF